MSIKITALYERLLRDDEIQRAGTAGQTPRCGGRMKFNGNVIGKCAWWWYHVSKTNGCLRIRCIMWNYNFPFTNILKEQKIIVHRALSKINPDYGKVLYLKYFEDLSNEQIARVMKQNRRQIENFV